MITCMIVDDEEYAVNVLKRLVEKTSFLKLLFATTDPLEAMEKLDEMPIDLVFLDMHLGSLNGIDFLKAAKGKSHFILCTAFSKYALESYEYNVIDYLLKPILYPRFLDAAQKALARITKETSAASPPGEFLLIKAVNKRRTVKLNYSDVLYMECVKNYICINTASDKYLIRGTMKELEASFTPGYFLRVHASFIVPLKNITGYDNTGIYVKGTSERIPISHTYKDIVLQILKSE